MAGLGNLGYLHSSEAAGRASANPFILSVNEHHVSFQPRLRAVTVPAQEVMLSHKDGRVWRGGAVRTYAE